MTEPTTAELIAFVRDLEQNYRDVMKIGYTDTRLSAAAANCAAIAARLEQADRMEQALRAMVSVMDDLIDSGIVAECDEDCDCAIHEARVLAPSPTGRENDKADQ